MTSELGSDDRLQACDQVRGLADGGILLGDVLPDQIADNDHARAWQCGSAAPRLRLLSGSRRLSGWRGRKGSPAPHRSRVGSDSRNMQVPVAQILRDHAAKRFYLVGATGVERRDDIALFLRVEARRKCAQRSGLDA